MGATAEGYQSAWLRRCPFLVVVDLHEGDLARAVRHALAALRGGDGPADILGDRLPVERSVGVLAPSPARRVAEEGVADLVEGHAHGECSAARLQGLRQGLVWPPHTPAEAGGDLVA